MSSSPPPSWSTGRPPNRLAGLPAGVSGRFGGHLMRVLNRGEQREVLDLVGTRPGDVLELGHGPGTLLAGLARIPGVTRLVGMDPSAEMRRLAVRALAREIARGRVEIWPGDAAATGLPDGSVDLVVSVNTVAVWPDLDAGVAELRRVLRPAGRLLLTWHGGDRPSRAARRLALTDAQATRIEDALLERFAEVRRYLTPRCTVFDARC